MYVIGTAGHVDHGKSTLVHALTGIDPDRLREEKARGMTIDLGFAWMQLPGGTPISIVDVPGHERFIKNMLAGVGGIDLAVVVVAADEGVMPQTREHLAILHLLGVEVGVVAVTKCDLVDDDWLELVQTEIAETLATTTLAAAPQVAVSAKTGEGIPALLAAIESRLTATPSKRDIGRPRLAIDRAFSVAGFGTVVTGTLIDGALRLGQEVEIVPSGVRSRVRGLQSHRTQITVARPGNRVAVNLPGVAVSQLARGQVLTTPGWLHTATAIDIRLESVADLTLPLKHNMAVTVHGGAAETSAKLRLLDRDELQSNGQGWAQLRLDRPMPLVVGDRVVVRTPNATVGGGVVVDAAAKRHRRRHAPTLAALARASDGTPEDQLYALIEQTQPTTIGALRQQFAGGAAQASALLGGLLTSGRVRALHDDTDHPSTQVATSAFLTGLAEAAHDTVQAYTREFPLRAGMPREELRARLGLATKPFQSMLARWRDDGVLEDRGAVILIPGYQPHPSQSDQRLIEQYLSELQREPHAPQPVTPISAEVLSYLVDQQQVVAVADGVVFCAATYNAMVERITQHLTDHGSVTLATVRDLFGTSRKFAQGILEHMDSQRVTRRVGDAHVLR